MRFTSRVLGCVALVSLGFGMIACGGGAEPTPAPAAVLEALATGPEQAPAAAAPAAALFTGEPIRLGLQAPLSGSYAAEGLAIKQAVELIVSQVNPAGGIDGHEVLLLVEDDRGDPAAATQAAERLVSQRVMAVIGSYNAATNDPASYVYNRAGIIHLMPSCAPPLAIDKGFHQTFRLCFRQGRTAQATANFVTEVVDAQKVAILTDGSPQASTLAGEVRQSTEALGGQVVAFEAVDAAASEPQPMLDRLRLANPEVVYFAGAAQTAAAVVRQARDAGVQVVWVLSNSANVPELATLIGPLGSASVYIVADPLPSQVTGEVSQEFAAAYRSQYSADPTLWGAMAADAFSVLGEAARATRSMDPLVLATYLHDRLWNYPGATGTVEGFDSAGDRRGWGDIVLRITPDGRVVPLTQ